MNPTRYCLCLTFAAGLCLSAGHAQTTTPADAPANPDQVIELSPFSVKSKNDNGYMPAESSSGARIAVQVKDLPYAVDIVTSEYLKDFNIFDLTEESALPSSVNGLDQGGNFNVRGFGGNITLRNGFARVGNFDMTSADRIEFIKGPAAAIYGQTAPGGIINIITKQPRTEARQSLSTSYGAYGNTRVDLESTGPIPLGSGKPKLFYIADVSYFHRNYEGKQLSTFSKSAYLDLLYKPTDDTSFFFDFDYNFTLNNNVVLPEQIDPTQATTSTHRYTGLALGLANQYYSNATNWNNRTIATFEAGFEHRFNSVFSVKTGFSDYHTPRYSYSSGGTSNYDPVANTMTRSTKPTFGFLVGDGQSAAIDLVASYNAGSTKNKTLLTIDYYKNIGDRPSYTAVSAVGPSTVPVNAATTVPYLPFVLSRVGTDYVATRLANDFARTIGTFLRHQIWAFDDRFVAVAGARFDDVFLHKHDDLTLYPAGTPLAGQHVADANIGGITHISTVFGFNYKITPSIIFYGSRSESFVPAQPSALDLTKTPVPVVPNQTGLGYETGFKFDSAANRFSATLALYEIKLDHLQVTEVDPSNPANTILTFDGGQKSKGVEFDANWRVNDHLTWLGTYSYTWSRPTDRGVDVDLMSRQFVKIPYTQAGSTVSYDFGNGLRAYVMTRYMSKAYVDTAGGITDAATKLVLTNNGQRLIQSPSYAVWNIGAAYKFKTAGHLSHTVNMTLKNVFDKFYVQPNRYVGDRFGVYVSYSLSH